MFKPMKAPIRSPNDYPRFFEELPYPLMVSPKIDGIRAVTKNDRVLSYNLTPIRSVQVQGLFSRYDDLDGELTASEPTVPNCINLCQTHVMAFSNPSDIMLYHVFDTIRVDMKDTYFYERYDYLKKEVERIADPAVRLVEHVNVDSYEELVAYEDEQLALGYEGIMLRNPVGIYKWNRATWMDQIVFKLKRFSDAEGVIIGFEEGMTNTNTLERDIKGYAKRSSSMGGMVPADTLGKFIVLWNGLELLVATGKFTKARCKEIWGEQDKYLGKLLKFRFFGYGVKDLPRYCRAIEFRDPSDL